LTEARQKGFAKASAHGGNVHLLAQHIAKALKPAAGPILYLAGDQVSADLHGLLTAHGFSVEKVIVYTAEPEIPAGMAAALREADGVLLYSPRTARLFASAVAGAGLDQAMQHVTCYCLSPNVALALPVNWTCKVAKRADEQGMLAMLDRGRQSR
jgi:uroporphyrinogen-III synthase